MPVAAQVVEHQSGPPKRPFGRTISMESQAGWWRDVRALRSGGSRESNRMQEWRERRRGLPVSSAQQDCGRMVGKREVEIC
jgi:hypothetical protein